MKKVLLTCVLALASMQLFSQEIDATPQPSTLEPESAPMEQQDEFFTDPVTAVKALLNYIDQTPGVKLRDVYKYSFQDVYGPGHIISDSLSCLNYITSELADSDTLGGSRFEELQLVNEYVRVNLSEIKNGHLTATELTSALLQSCRPTLVVEEGMWVEFWLKICPQVMERIDDENVKEENLEMQEMLFSGQYMMHHSKAFNEKYNYHYRLIKREVFESQLLPLIKQREANPLTTNKSAKQSSKRKKKR